MLAIYKREMRAYFTSPIAYIIIAVFVALSSIYFVNTSLAQLTADMSYVFSFISSWILIILAPILTMRLMSEEKKLKTDQLLLTSPVSLTGIVAGKFLSAVTLFLLCECITLPFLTITMLFGTEPPIGEFFGYFIGLLLLAAAVISITLFISSLTENQVIAVFASFGVGIILLLLQSLAGSATNATLSMFLNWLSLFSRYSSSFANGVFNFTDVFYFLSIAVIFLFLTVRVLEKRRWS